MLAAMCTLSAVDCEPLVTFLRRAVDVSFAIHIDTLVVYFEV